MRWGGEGKDHDKGRGGEETTEAMAGRDIPEKKKGAGNPKKRFSSAAIKKGRLGGQRGEKAQEKRVKSGRLKKKKPLKKD